MKKTQPISKGKSIKAKKTFWVSEETHTFYMKFLNEINSSTSKHSKELATVIVDDLLSELKKQLTPKFKETLRARRVDGASEFEVYKNKYLELNKSKSERDWTCFIMSPEFSKFRKDNIDCLKELLA